MFNAEFIFFSYILQFSRWLKKRDGRYAYAPLSFKTLSWLKKYLLVTRNYHVTEVLFSIVPEVVQKIRQFSTCKRTEVNYIFSER
jgi:hypothetical protein